MSIPKYLAERKLCPKCACPFVRIEKDGWYCPHCGARGSIND